MSRAGLRASPRATRLFAAIAAALIAFGASARANAQACCGAASAVTPGRLTLQEDLIVGAQLRVQRPNADFDDDRHYRTAPSGASEWDGELDLFATARIARRGQLGVVVPLLETWRATPTIASNGGGVGDARLTGRWDFIRPGASRRIPRVALLAGVTFPTGRPPERAHDALAAGATGRGAFSGSIGLGVEQTFGAWLVLVQELVSQPLARDVNGVRSQLGLSSTTLAAVAYTFDDESTLGAFVTYDVERDAKIDGSTSAGSGSSLATFGLAVGHPFTDTLRMQGSLTASPPISGFGRNRPAGPAISVTIVRGWG